METNFSSNTTEEDTAISDVNLPLGFVIELAMFLILSENLLILLTIRLYKKLKVVDLLILSLAMSDFVNALLPLQLLNVKANFLISPWPQWLCGLFVWTTYTLRLASLGTVSLMSIEKAMLLLQPLRYYTQLTLSLTRKVILATWIFSAITAVLPASLKEKQKGSQDVYCRYHPYQFGMGFGVFVETIGMIHFVTVLGSYAAMVVSSKSFQKRQKTMLSTRKKGEGGVVMKNSKGREETQGMLQARQLCRVMGYVVVLYYVTWLPFLIYNLHSLLTKTTRYNQKMAAVVGTFSLATPILNPLLYVKMSTRYRKGVLIILGRFTPLGSRNKTVKCIYETSNNEMATTVGRSRAITTVTICEKDRLTKRAKKMESDVTSSNSGTSHGQTVGDN